MSKEAKHGVAEAIAAHLRDAIERGEYGPGDQLPGENTLIKDYGAARLTVRSALGMLQAEGLTTTKRGVGVFVRSFDPIVRNGISRVSARKWKAGRSVWDDETRGRRPTVDHFEIVPEVEAPRDVAAIFDSNEKVATRRRRYSLDDKPVIVATSYLPADLVAGTRILDEDTGPGGIYARLADIGQSPAHFREDILSRMPTKAETEELAIPAGTPVFVLTRTAVTEAGDPVEVNVMVMDAGAYVLRYDFDA
ncbi:GntR family transcriptional regulator [Promicromonospora sukumoe]